MMSTDSFSWQEDLPLGAQHCREVFARYGLAMYYAQCVEQQLGLMLASIYNQKFLEVPPEDREAFYEKELAKTLGQMAKDLRNKTTVSSTLDARLREAVSIRNWLAHDYFYQRSREINSPSGREEMISELQEKADFLQALDHEFTEIMYKWLNHFGVSREDVLETMRVFFCEKESQ